MKNISADKLRKFTQKLLEAGGFIEEDARLTTELLVWANLRGIESHGVLRVPRYLEMLNLGLVTTGSAVKIVRDFGAIKVIDGGKCPGSVGMLSAANYATNQAKQFGVGVCSARSISHAGAIGFFAKEIADKGFVGIVMTASKPLMAYFGARGEALSTNPISIAIPTKDGDAPLLLDMSTAAVALGKIMAAKDNGDAIPLGWAIDKDGKQTTDPHAVSALLPMAGPKGSGLSLMLEVLSSILSGNSIIGPVLAKQKKGGFNGLVIALDPNAFGDFEAFIEGVELLKHQIKSLEKSDGFDEVLLPGERGNRIELMRRAEGIPVAQGTIERLLRTAEKLGVTPPDELIQ